MKPCYFLALVCCLTCVVAGTAAEFLGKVAFLRDGNLWVQDMPDGVARQVTMLGKALYPDWSATGRWLAYNEDTSTYVVDVANPQNRRRLPAEFLATTWSPTEDVLAYTRSPGGLFLTHAGKWEEKSLVCELPNAASSISNFFWSPDGKEIAFVRVRTSGREMTDRTAELYTIRVNGSGLHRLLRVTGESYRPIITGWTPDGKYILFLQDTAYSASLLADGVPLAAVPAVGGRVLVFTTNTLDSGGLSLSPDGRRIAVLQREGRESWQDARLFISPLDRVSLHPLTNKTVAPLFPAWSPQGNLLAYTTGPTGSIMLQMKEANRLIAQRHILLINPVTGIRQGDTRTDDNRDEYPFWTADGRHFLFARITPERQAGVWAMNLVNGIQRQVVKQITTNEPESGWMGFYGTVNWPAILAFWPGRRLAESGLLVDRQVQVPLRAVVEALGGTVSWQADSRTAMVTLNGKTFTRTPGSDADFSQVYNHDFWMKDNLLYIPVSLLQQEFTLGVQWNAPAREVVVNNSPTARILIIPTRIVPSLRVPVVGRR